MPAGVSGKWPKMAKNGQKWPILAGRPKKGQKWPKMAKNGQKWPKIGHFPDFAAPAGVLPKMAIFWLRDWSQIRVFRQNAISARKFLTVLKIRLKLAKIDDFWPNRADGGGHPFF